MESTTSPPVCQAPSPFLDRTQAAGFLRISKSSIDNLVRSGELPRIRLGTRVVFDVIDLTAWARSKKTQAVPHD